LSIKTPNTWKEIAEEDGLINELAPPLLPGKIQQAQLLRILLDPTYWHLLGNPVIYME
jgi:hypothetical protein